MTVRFGTLKYVVGSFFAFGSPMVISTPGGIDIGIRPSFEALLVVLENCRRGEAWKAGTRKLGSVMAVPEIDFSSTLLRLGASITVVGDPASIGRLNEGRGEDWLLRIGATTKMLGVAKIDA